MKRKLAIIVTAILVVCTFSCLLVREVIQFKITRQSEINSEAGIDVLEKVQIGGVEQWLYIRGKDKSKPIILWLDGGPGEPLIAYARDIGFKTGLENEFVIVYWDQKGTGKSYNDKIEINSMTINQFVTDTIEITDYLKEKFGVQKIYLVGRSWGTRIGLLAAEQMPNNYFAYVGIGQAVNSEMADLEGYNFAYKTAQIKEDKGALKELSLLGLPPYDSKGLMIQRKYVIKYGGFSKTGIDLRKNILKSILVSPEYTMRDIINVIFHSDFPLDCLRNEINEMNLLEDTTKIDVPTYFLEGRHDFMVSSSLAEKFYDKLDVPKGKKLIWFEDSAHVLNYDEPKKFYKTMVDVVLKETYSK